MKPGSHVFYVERGREYAAEVVGVPGSGPSGWKTLDLLVGKAIREAVPHERDKGRKGFWREHAASDHETVHVPAPVVPEATAEGRATAGVGDTSEEQDERVRS